VYPVLLSEFQLRTTSGGYEVVDDTQRRVVSLNPPAALILQYCNGGRTLEQIAAELSAALPSADADRIACDVRDTVNEMESCGILAMAEHRSLPDFVIAGAQKSGTTALQRNLRRHRQVYMPERELHFFSIDRNWKRGPGWYRSFFPESRLLQGEKTPNYLAIQEAHRRMNWLIPTTRLIVILRDPVLRAFSHWNHFNQIADESTKWGWKVCDFESSLHANPSVLQFGLYADQLENLFRFFPEDVVHISINEDFRRASDGEFAKICNFLGLASPGFPYESHHSRQYCENMPVRVRRKLAEYYYQPNERLFELLGRRIDDWTSLPGRQ